MLYSKILIEPFKLVNQPSWHYSELSMVAHWQQIGDEVFTHQSYAIHFLCVGLLVK